MARVLKQGMSGADVFEVEQRLTEEGYYVGGVDEQFDVYTDAAVRYYQSLNGLTVDGIVGPATRAALGLGDGTGGGGGNGDQEFGIEVRSIAADSAHATYSAQAVGWRGGAGSDFVTWQPGNGDVPEVVEVPFEIGPHGSYDRDLPTPPSILAYWEAQQGNGFTVTVATNIGEGSQGAADVAETVVPGWTGGF
jgi:hypothetical protein